MYWVPDPDLKAAGQRLLKKVKSANNDLNKALKDLSDYETSVHKHHTDMTELLETSDVNVATLSKRNLNEAEIVQSQEEALENLRKNVADAQRNLLESKAELQSHLRPFTTAPNVNLENTVFDTEFGDGLPIIGTDFSDTKMDTLFNAMRQFDDKVGDSANCRFCLTYHERKGHLRGL